MASSQATERTRRVSQAGHQSNADRRRRRRFNAMPPLSQAPGLPGAAAPTGLDDSQQP